jgi:uncharacterized protein (DUF1778 family)
LASREFQSNAPADGINFPAICRMLFRMPATSKTERLEARVPVSLKKVIQRAANLKGLTLTDFVIASLDRSAREAVREYDTMTLNAADSLRVAKLLIHPPKPTAALRQAFRWHAATVSMK